MKTDSAYSMIQTPPIPQPSPITKTSSALFEHRAKAAELSRGTSGGPIYALIERVIAERGLQGRILDYGAGVGQLTRRLVALGRFASVSATDIMAAPADLIGQAEWIEQDLNVPLPGHDGAFDVVVAAEVIEHLENPRFMIREIFRLLRPGGTAIVTTPNNESWRSLIALLVRGHFLEFGDSGYPAHITALLRKDLERIFREASFIPQGFEFTNAGALPGKPSLRWQQISFGLLKGVRYSDNVLAIATKPAEGPPGECTILFT
jgi:2-polyprenyl-3-methyl-5-hydroxy-6-metoxy-1,4-benzoquinol methylase